MAFQYAERLANGDAVMVDSDLLDKLRDGDPISGWSGDPNMSLSYSKVDDCVYLWTLDDNGEPYDVMKSPPGCRVVDMKILFKLAERDRNRGYDVAKELEKHNDAIEAEKDAILTDKFDAAAEKLAWGLKKDLSN